jgi:hypothetical protein
MVALVDLQLEVTLRGHRCLLDYAMNAEAGRVDGPPTASDSDTDRGLPSGGAEAHPTH